MNDTPGRRAPPGPGPAVTLPLAERDSLSDVNQAAGVMTSRHDFAERPRLTVVYWAFGDSAFEPCVRSSRLAAAGALGCSTTSASVKTAGAAGRLISFWRG